MHSPYGKWTAEDEFTINFKSPSFQFVALPVGSGDAFYLGTGSSTFLVDGGGSSPRLKSLVRDYVNSGAIRMPKILICTHADSDHANGFTGYVKDSEFECAEIWLPASWRDRIDELISDPTGFIKLTRREYLERRSEFPMSHSLGSLGDMFSEGTLPLRTVTESWTDDDSQMDVLDDSLAARGINIPIDSTLRRIASIVSHAQQRKIRIRWFRFDSRNKPEGGIVGHFEPMNAIEETESDPTKSDRSRFEYAALTVSNRESLVFGAKHPGEDLSILFTADSDLDFQHEIAWQANMLVTAPHHGSDANVWAYLRMSLEVQDVNDLVMVRSDSNSIHRPGKAYRRMPMPKYCTRCQDSSADAQCVELELRDGKWHPKSTRPCECHFGN